jgi:3-oxoacyl-[acyl-carrier protein] reductase
VRGAAGVAESAALELADSGVTVNLVGPGRIDTDRLRLIDQELALRSQTDYATRRRSSEGSIPAGRYGTADEVAALVSFLASEDAGYVTGQTVLVDGGLVAALP